MATTKKCNHCGRELPLEMFHKCERSSDGHQPMCKACKAEYSAMKLEEKKRKKEEIQKAVEKMPKDADSITLNDGTVLHKVKQECKPLEKYMDRELFAELIRRGWQWEDGGIWIKQFVYYNKI